MIRSLFIAGALSLAAVQTIHATPAHANLTAMNNAETGVRDLIPNARLSGSGTFKVFGFHIYDARLFVGPRGLGEDLASAQPYALDLRYARNFKGNAIAKRTRKEMERLNLATDAQRREWEAVLIRLFPDVQKGDHLTGVYRPDRSTIFLKNGRKIGEVEGADFARAFFGIWLHPDTVAPAVRTALLARAAQP